MRDLIDRKQALKEIHDRHEKAVEWFLGTTNDEIKARAETALASFTECYLTIQSLPSAETMKGRWIWVRFNIECSLCGFQPCFDSTEPLYNYCPCCGTKMEVSG